jgi:hypothetical protein
MIRSVAISLIFLIFLSCKKDNLGDCFKSNGKQTTQVRMLEPFYAIDVIDKCVVNVHQGNEHKVEIHCGENLLHNISTSVKDNTLTIENNNKCNFVRGYKKQIVIDITTPHITWMVNNGVGTVFFDENYAQDSIVAEVANSGDFHLSGNFRVVKTSSNGNGDMYVSGTAKKLYVFTTGINYVDTKNLTVSDYMFIHTLSIGDCHINAQGTQTFEYNIQKEGNIYYSGDPAIVRDFGNPEAKGKAIRE